MVPAPVPVAARPRLQFRPVRSTPQLTYRTRFRVHFGARIRLRLRSKQPRYLCLVRQSVCSFWNPVREFGGTENHPAPNNPKLGRLRCARQGLVRVPESNTKYGGKDRKPRGQTAPRLGPSISESSGIPKGKNLSGGCEFNLPPAVHRATIYCGHMAVLACTSKTHVGLRRCSGWHAGAAMVSALDKRQGDADSRP